MTGEQIKLFSKMKKLIIEGKRKFANRKDRDYIQELLDIGISENEAWNEILTLSSKNYCFDYKPFYLKNNNDTLIFKKYIHNNLVYIKIKLEKCNNDEMTVCLSFHIDYQ